ncbi:MAG: hypothetical protein AABY86_07830, partial [Bdellovibrionota bacterium]
MHIVWITSNEQWRTYENKIDGPTIVINGEVLTYNALAYQQEVLSKNESLKQTAFSDITLKENGNVKFHFTEDEKLYDSISR